MCPGGGETQHMSNSNYKATHCWNEEFWEDASQRCCLVLLEHSWESDAILVDCSRIVNRTHDSLTAGMHHVLLWLFQEQGLVWKQMHVWMEVTVGHHAWPWL